MRQHHMLLLVCLLLSACSPAANPTPLAARTPVRRVEAPPADPGRVTTRSTPAPDSVPLLAAHQAKVAAALASATPVLTLEGLGAAEQQAQVFAVADPRVLADLRAPDGSPMRGEVFGVYPLGPADLTPATAACGGRACFRVEVYNYARNRTVLAVVDPAAGVVIDVRTLPDTQPTVVPKHLMDLAAQLAVASPDVRTELGLKPDATMIQQPQMKVQFQASACERSRHLCVAPIFPWGERALWVIVDLTAYTIIGLRWTDLGASSRVPLTEQRLQDDIVTASFCDKATALARDGWDLRYILTGSDGLRVDAVRFKGASVLHSAKLVDIHISYATKAAFGYSDALGCPAFSAAAVVAWNGPQIEPIRAPDGVEGFALVQRFRSEFWPAPCNYAYVQRYEFYRDGRFRPVFVSEGRGCGTEGTYRPVMRIVPAIDTASFAAWDGTGWKEWPAERWQLQQSAPTTPEGYQYRVSDAAGQGWLIAPGHGQFPNGKAGDNAYLYVSRDHPERDEGESDLATLGDCCNPDERQGPERFLTPAEPLGVGPLVLWYVPQLKNSDTPGSEACWADAALKDGLYVPKIWPCAAGPLFVPIGDRHQATGNSAPGGQV